MAYYLSFFLFELIPATLHFFFALLCGIIFGCVLGGRDRPTTVDYREIEKQFYQNNPENQYRQQYRIDPYNDPANWGVGYSPVIFMFEWALTIFCLHMLAVTTAMMLSTFFVSSHGSKMVFVVWAINLLPCLGLLIGALNLKEGWRFLPGQLKKKSANKIYGYLANHMQI